MQWIAEGYAPDWFYHSRQRSAGVLYFWWRRCL